MNNHHRMSKRKRQAILFFTYGFMTLATVVISIFCLLLILGYRFDVSDRKIEQGGLLQFRSTPDTANVYVDGKLLGSKTPTKLDVTAGQHAIRINKEGYREWSRSVIIHAGELRWLNYARLVPTKLTTTTVLKLPEGASDAMGTPDRRFVAIVPKADQPIIQIADLRNEEDIQLQSFTVPTDQLTVSGGQVSHYRIQEWDYGSRFLMVTHQFGDQLEYIRIDRTSDTGSARNITREFNLPFRDMHFSGTSGNVFYGLTGTDIRRIDTDAGSVSQPLVNGVESYRLYRENDIAFVAVRVDKRVAGVYLNNKETIVRSVALEQTMMADLSQYYAHYYLAITTQTGVDIIKDPAESSEKSVRTHAALTKGAFDMTWVDFASSGRFVLVGNTTAYSLYDLETDETFTVNGPLSLDAGSHPTWLDDFIMVTTSPGTIRLADYDGNYRQDITSAVSTLPAFLGDDGKFLYSFVDKDGGRALQSTRMVLE